MYLTDAYRRRLRARLLQSAGRHEYELQQREKELLEQHKAVSEASLKPTLVSPGAFRTSEATKERLWDHGDALQHWQGQGQGSVAEVVQQSLQCQQVSVGGIRASAARPQLQAPEAVSNEEPVPRMTPSPHNRSWEDLSLKALISVPVPQQPRQYSAQELVNLSLCLRRMQGRIRDERETEAQNNTKVKRRLELTRPSRPPRFKREVQRPGSREVQRPGSRVEMSDEISPNSTSPTVAAAPSRPRRPPALKPCWVTARCDGRNECRPKSPQHKFYCPDSGKANPRFTQRRHPRRDCLWLRLIPVFSCAP